MTLGTRSIALRRLSRNSKTEPVLTDEEKRELHRITVQDFLNSLQCLPQVAAAVSAITSLISFVREQNGIEYLEAVLISFPGFRIV
jgi:hypothetical protein